MTTLEKPAGTPSVALLCCPHCSLEFRPKRTNQRYCKRDCAKAATRNAKRSDRTAENRCMNEAHYSRALDLADMLYTAPVDQRLGVMKNFLDAAGDHDKALRRILTDPKLLTASPLEKHYFHRKAPFAYKTVSQAANAYTQKFFGVSVQTYFEKVSKGAISGEYKVARKTDLGAVPRLNILRHPKCWHRPLSKKLAA